MPPLIFSVFHGETNAVRRLLDAGENVKQRDDFGRNALIVAAMYSGPII